MRYITLLLTLVHSVAATGQTMTRQGEEKKESYELREQALPKLPIQVLNLIAQFLSFKDTEEDWELTSHAYDKESIEFLTNSTLIWHYSPNKNFKLVLQYGRCNPQLKIFLMLKKEYIPHNPSLFKSLDIPTFALSNYGHLAVLIRDPYKIIFLETSKLFSYEESHLSSLPAIQLDKTVGEPINIVGIQFNKQNTKICARYFPGTPDSLCEVFELPEGIKNTNPPSKTIGHWLKQRGVCKDFLSQYKQYFNQSGEE